MQYRALLIDDNHDVLEMLRPIFLNYLQFDYFDNPTLMLKMSREKLLAYDLFFIDYHLPGCSGLNLLDFLYTRLGKERPYFILTYDDKLALKTKAFAYPIADFLQKDMEDGEILARVKSKLDNFGPQNRFEDIELSAETFEVRITQKVIDVTRKEFSLLSLIIRNQGSVPRTELIAEVWKNVEVLPATLNTHIYNLNKKLRIYAYSVTQSKQEGIVSLIRIG